MNNFHEKEIAKLSSHVHEVLGDRLNTFYRRRFVALDKYLKRILKNHDGCAVSITRFAVSFDHFLRTPHVFSDKCHLRNASHSSGLPSDNHANAE